MPSPCVEPGPPAGGGTADLTATSSPADKPVSAKCRRHILGLISVPFSVRALFEAPQTVVGEEGKGSPRPSRLFQS